MEFSMIVCIKTKNVIFSLLYLTLVGCFCGASADTLRYVWYFMFKWIFGHLGTLKVIAFTTLFFFFAHFKGRELMVWVRWLDHWILRLCFYLLKKYLCRLNWIILFKSIATKYSDILSYLLYPYGCEINFDFSVIKTFQKV